MGTKLLFDGGGSLDFTDGDEMGSESCVGGEMGDDNCRLSCFVRDSSPAGQFEFMVALDPVKNTIGISCGFHMSHRDLTA